MQVAAPHEGLELVRVAAFVVYVACMQWLMHIANQMDKVLQRDKPLLVRRVGLQDCDLLFDGIDNAVAIGTVPLLNVGPSVRFV